MNCRTNFFVGQHVRTVVRFNIIIDIAWCLLQNLINIHLNLLCQGCLDVLKSVLLAESTSELTRLLFLSFQDNDVFRSIIAQVDGDADDFFLAVRPVIWGCSAFALVVGARLKRRVLLLVATNSHLIIAVHLLFYTCIVVHLLDTKVSLIHF